MDLIKENIENLTSLWQTVGKRANAFQKEKGLSFCGISNSEWPNKLWFNEEPDETTIKHAKEILTKSKVGLKIPCWDIYPGDVHSLFEGSGFEKTSRQIGMALKLEKKYTLQGRIRLQKVSTEEQTVLWSGIFEKAFNYRINSNLVSMSCEDIDYFIFSHLNQLVGTCALFGSNKKVIGLHSLGIIPEMRRRGFAEEILKLLINRSIEKSFTYCTLQASEMGKAMYYKNGFKTQFVITNYQLKS